MSHSQIDHAIAELVRRTIRETIADHAAPSTPDLITIEETCQICRCDRSVIDALIVNAHDNGFPIIKLGTRTKLVDRNRLYAWLNAGGLNSDGKHNAEGRPEIPRPSLKAVPRSA